MTGTPFALLAIKDGACDGVCTFQASAISRVGFASEFLSAGYTILPVATREEYLAKLAECHGTLGQAPEPLP